MVFRDDEVGTALSGEGVAHRRPGADRKPRERAKGSNGVSFSWSISTLNVVCFSEHYLRHQWALGIWVFSNTLQCAKSEITKNPFCFCISKYLLCADTPITLLNLSQIPWWSFNSSVTSQLLLEWRGAQDCLESHNCLIPSWKHLQEALTPVHSQVLTEVDAWHLLGNVYSVWCSRPPMSVTWPWLWPKHLKEQLKGRSIHFSSQI